MPDVSPVGPVSSVPSGVVQCAGDPPPCPTAIRFNFTPIGGNEHAAQVPPCGNQVPRAIADATGVTWSLAPGTVAVDAGTSIAADGNITIAAAQAAGEITVRATSSNPACNVLEMPLRLRSHPTGIASTQVVAPAGGTDYGATFDHVFNSADGNVASLEGVAVGERFIGIPSPAAAVHNLGPAINPFGGTFTLHTATLTPNATNNWFLTAAGELGGTHDSVTTEQANINVGRFVRSASNPSPPRALPAGFTITQGLHWFCPHAAGMSRWRMPAFARVGHSRHLRTAGGDVEFVTTVNGVEQVDDYVGPPAVFNATASPVNTPRSQPPPTAPRTVSIRVDTLPAALGGAALDFSIPGNALGCAVAADPADDHAAVLTIGTTAGTVTVEASESTHVNRDRVAVTVT